MNQSKFPPGWDEEKVRKVLAHYENQTEEEAVTEDEFLAGNRTIRTNPRGPAKNRKEHGENQ